MEKLKKRVRIKRMVLRFWKDKRKAGPLLSCQIHPKVGLVWSCFRLAGLNYLVTPSTCSRAFTALIPLLVILLDPECSSRWKWWKSKQTESHAGWRKGVFFHGFSPFLCLPVNFKFKGLPSRQSVPSFPPEKRRATAHSCGFYPGYHVADTANHRPALSSFKI